MTRIFIVYTVVRQALEKHDMKEEKHAMTFAALKGNYKVRQSLQEQEVTFFVLNAKFLLLYQLIKRVHSFSITLDLPSYI